MRITLALLATFAATITAQDTVTATQSGVCEPHDDHWHCPAGVPQPTTPPPVAAVTPAPSSNSTMTMSHSHDDDDDDHDHAVTATTCEPHGNHWHCPSGVSQPTFLPEVTTSRPASAASSTPQFTGMAAKVGSGVGAAVAAVGAVLL